MSDTIDPTRETYIAAALNLKDRMFPGIIERYAKELNLDPAQLSLHLWNLIGCQWIALAEKRDIPPGKLYRLNRSTIEHFKGQFRDKGRKKRAGKFSGTKQGT